MFGIGRGSDTSSPIAWSQLLSLLEDDDRRAAVIRDYPESSRESFLMALRRVDGGTADAVLAAGRQLETAEPLSRYPTIAVAGMLNSGKTSLVATFLSPAGQQRTLRGDQNAQGTHRFVLWLPSLWQREPDVWSLLLRRIGEALGHPPEMLSTDPAEAHQQYNNLAGGEDALGIPLVATDPGLDHYGVGLLDCPDVVSDAAFGRGAPQQRRELLRRAAPLCSAFLVVTAANTIRDTTLSELLAMGGETMPGVPRFLAVNQVRNLPPEAIWEDTRELREKHAVDDLLVAYDYHVPSSEPFIPVLETDTATPPAEPLPTFFRVRPDADDNPPAAIAEDELRTRMLSALPGTLDHGALFAQVRSALESRLREAIWRDGIQRLRESGEASQQTANVLRERLLDAILDFFARREPGGKIAELRLHQSKAIVLQLGEAFALAAPWYARFGMRLHAKLRRLWGGAADLAKRFTPSKIAEEAAINIRDRFRSGKQGSLLTAARLSDAILQRTSLDDFPAIHDETQLHAFGDRAIERFIAEDFTALDPERLQTAVEEVWQNMPVMKKVKAGLTPLAIIFTAFGAALMVPVDFIGSPVVLAASVKELFVAAGVSLAGAAWGGGLSIVDLERQAAAQQISNFLAVACDTLGIPREDERTGPTVNVADRRVTLPPPTLDQRGLPADTLVTWHVRPEFEKELAQYVRQL